MQYHMTVIENGKKVEERVCEDHEVDRYIVLEAEGLAFGPLGETTTIRRGNAGDICVRTINSSGGTIVTSRFVRVPEND